MSEASELQRLEIFVGKLLTEFKDLQKEIAEKNTVIEELNDQLAMHQLEREDISDRVARIVTQFESWEKEVVEKSSGEAEVSSSQEKSLYSGE